MCMTRLSIFAPGEAVTITPLRTFPVIKDLVTDVSFNYEKARQVPAFKPSARPAGGPFHHVPSRTWSARRSSASASSAGCARTPAT